MKNFTDAERQEMYEETVAVATDKLVATIGQDVVCDIGQQLEAMKKIVHEGPEALHAIGSYLIEIAIADVDAALL